MARLFLATANVGSVFENIEEGLERWLDNFLDAVQENSPHLVAIHFQECGGKNYQNCTNEIRVFFSELKRRFEELKFFQIEGFVDSQAEIEDQFTALANVYFLHKDLSTNNVQIWNFKEKLFAPVSTDHPLHIGEELTHTERKQKEKFPQHFFPDFKWSRKGFLRTRWRINGVLIDLVNCHLFHDSCNLIAGSAFPSPFAQNRLKTLNYTLDKLLQDEVVMFIFGDFNFRLNTYEVFESLRRQHTDQDDSSRKPAVENDNEVAIDSKYFSCPDQEQRFKHDFQWLQQYEFEAAQFIRLSELTLNFHPTYPFDESLPDKFMRTRCPAWCDRVLFTHNAKSVIFNANESQPVYQLVGTNVCMGDHKPVYLSFTLQSDEESLLSNEDAKKFENNEAVGDNSDAANTEDKNCCQVEMEEDKSVDSIKSSRRKCKCLVSFFRKSLISKGKRRHGSGDLENNGVLLNSTDCDLENKCSSPDTQVASNRIKLQSSSSSARNGNNGGGGGENSNNNCQEIRNVNSKSRSNSIFKKKYSKWKSKEYTTTNNEQSMTSSPTRTKSGTNPNILPTDDKSNNSNSSSINNIKLAKITSSPPPPQAVNSQDLLLSHMITDLDVAKFKSLDDNEEPESLALSFDRLSLNHSATNSMIEIQDEVQCQPLNPNTNDNEESGKKVGGKKNRTKLFGLSRKKKGREANVRKEKNSSQNNQENETTSTILCNKCVIL